MNRATGEGPPGDAVDRLYGLPLGEFTSERDRMARELRRDGSREEADLVRALRKPTVPAWALNQLARRRGALDELLAAGEELRSAQEQILAGGEGRDRLRAAVEAERRAIASLVEQADALLAAESHKPSAQVLDRIRDTLHAASGDQQVRELLRSGRLVEDAQPVGLGPAPVGAPSRGKPSAAAAPPRRKRSDPDAGAARRRREELRTARAEIRRAEQAVARAARRVGEAEAELESARSEAERASAGLERRRDELARLEEHSG